MIRGVMEDGRVVDLWHGTEGEPDTAAPEYIGRWYPDYRWRKYLWRVPETENRRQLENFARYYCRAYNQFDRGETRLGTLTIDYHRLWTKPDYQPRELKVIRLLNWDCLIRERGAARPGRRP